jgi:CubicO group peptidase (beta-lactamase class C family)
MTTSTDAVGMSAARLDRINPVMQAHVDSGVFAGVDVLVARHGQTVFRAQYGQRDREAAKPMTADTIFRIYSMTKPIVSTALMMLFEEGRIRLLDPVAKFIPSFGGVKVQQADGSLTDPAAPVTVKQVLSHTAGLTYDFLEESPVSDLYRDARLMHDGSRSLADTIELLATLPLAFQPGERWAYSVGIDVAARLIEVVSGQPLHAFLQERMFDPLGMASTGFGVAADRLDDLHAMYGLPDIVGVGTKFSGQIAAWMSGFNERIDVSASYPTDKPEVFNRGGHGLFSTTDDYARFAQMLLNGGELDGRRVIGRKTLELMHSNHLPPALLPWNLAGLPNPGWGFGLGSRVSMDPAGTGNVGSVGEFGWAGAAKTYFWVDPVEDIVGVIMTQHMMGFEMIEQDLRAIVYGAIVD